MDIENYNYIDILIKDYQQGQLTEEIRIQQHIKSKSLDEEFNKEQLHAGEVFLPPESEPPGVKFRRNNIDYVNNFFVDLVAISFTNIKEMQQTNKEDVENQSFQDTLIEIEKFKKQWKEQILADTDVQLDSLEKRVDMNLMRTKMDRKSISYGMLKSMKSSAKN